MLALLLAPLVSAGIIMVGRGLAWLWDWNSNRGTTLIGRTLFQHIMDASRHRLNDWDHDGHGNFVCLFKSEGKMQTVEALGHYSFFFKRGYTFYINGFVVDQFMSDSQLIKLKREIGNLEPRVDAMRVKKAAERQFERVIGLIRVG